MGILDGNSFDPASFQQASEAASPGWLSRVLPSRGAAPQAGNPFAALLGGLGAALSPASGQSAQAPGLGERANAALMSFLNGHGVLPAIGGAIAGATTGQRTDPVGLMQAQQAATVRALMSVGITPDVAQAAAQHPDFMRLIAPQLVVALQRRDAAGQGAPAPTAPALAATAAAPQPPRSASPRKTRKE